MKSHENLSLILPALQQFFMKYAVLLVLMHKTYLLFQPST